MNGTSKAAAWQDIDPSKLTITKKENPSTLPDKLVWGAEFADHMLLIKHTPGIGWGAPEIVPYGPLSLSPASAVFHYAPSLFEGMKAYKTDGQEPVLFRPDRNMARMQSSAARVALPTFDADKLIELIATLVKVNENFIPAPPYSLYLRPTMIGTRPTLGVGASEDCLLYVICSPVGPFFPQGFKPVSLLATTDAVRSWPGGTGQYKLALNYAPCFLPQKIAQQKGYDQNLWCLGDRITECGQMNLFVVHADSEDGKTHLITPPLNGEILPGVTRASLLELARSGKVPGLTKEANGVDLLVEEREFGVEDLRRWDKEGKIREVFGAGTAAVICPVERIGLPSVNGGSADITDITIPTGEGGLGPVARALWSHLTGIQEGKIEGPEGWTYVCK